ncbi:glutathione S-transferase T3-like [Eutrema salsugineum]|uniref:glutathione S-transferase T3-like n=1 Tax=Eutrema salsugineum TaxID=72664 RepID=UPI000CECF6CD|nr:glutathione S-transferase T3-like [Eutrema salsugineum]
MGSSFPFTPPSTFVDLLTSQQENFLSFPAVDLGSSQASIFSSQTEETPAEKKERRTWTPAEDLLLISSWLNTSKDPVVANEQKNSTFWSRIADYFGASPLAVGREIRGPMQCKQRWQKIKENLCKFSGAYAAALRAKASGMNENDVLKMAHEIFFTDHKKKFTMDHAWQELCYDQKWCELTAAKTDGKKKRRRSQDGT